MTMIGHNNGPTMERGRAWRRHAWTRARAELLPTLPLEVVRMRVRRARELGLDYRAYASIRAASGHDVVALLFSSNALRVGPRNVTVPADRAERLGALASCGRLAILHAPTSPEAFAFANPMFDAAGAAPRFTDGWAAMRAALRQLTADRGLPGDRVVLIGETAFEREWTQAGKLAGYIPADRYFGASA
ncbi:hypothetical protein ACRDNQ_00790 [Palleronia sp. KMU-117]|uniref:hypothetical protein n=1 Tax=Palleronia sp. KMU-117 TaxID=3434108 RepID=UPI003D73205A